MKLSNYKALEDDLISFNNDDLIRLVYVSNITKRAKRDSALFEHIQGHAAVYNKNHDIKGFLCNSNRYFLQCLEGRKSVLLPLMSRIFKDDRHTNVHVVLIKSIKHYAFTDWHMRSIFLDQKIGDKTAGKIGANNVRFEEFLPFEPHDWPTWMFDHFVNTMQKFDNLEQGTPFYDIRYDSVGQESMFANVFVLTLITVIIVLVALLLLVKLFYWQ